MKQRLTLLLLILVAIGNAQNDWIKGSLLLKNGDTISGDLSLPLIDKGVLANTHKIKFKNGEYNKKTKYDHTTVNKALIKDRNNETIIYEYVKTSKSKFQLFKLIKFQKVKLYARNVSNTTMSPNTHGQSGYTSYTSYSSRDNEYYALREGEIIASPLITVTTNISAAPFTKSFRKRAMKYFSDCPSLVSKIKKRKYRERYILRILEEYDECK